MNQTTKKRLVLNITRMTIHNGPGFRTLVLFKGCPLRCLWCSTPESQKSGPEIAIHRKKCTQCGNCLPVCPTQAISLSGSAIDIDRQRCNNCGECAKVCFPEAIELLGQPMTAAEIVTEVESDSVIYKHSGGGVTISGGEPLMQPDFTRELVETFRQRGISVGVDTCGYVPMTDLEQVLPYVDFFLWDIKHMDPHQHKKLTGVSNELILSNARAVAEKGVPIYIRLPVIPGYNDTEENIRAACEFSATLPSLVEVDLLPLHHLGESRYASLDRPYPLSGVPLITDDVMQALERIVTSYQLKCRIGG